VPDKSRTIAERKPWNEFKRRDAWTKAEMPTKKLPVIKDKLSMSSPDENLRVLFCRSEDDEYRKECQREWEPKKLLFK
jgi:hypothetical protein